ncbi:MAG: hypothetical protein HY303_21090 [Candidatus Wallbacteria bacterium]|nr:hypothetical protein [Candidatus Wallbacteria bacterium]
MMQDLEKLGKEAEKSAPEAAKEIQQALEKAKQDKLPEDVSAARQALEKKDAQSALQRQKQAFAKMKSMQDSLNQTQAGMKKKQISINLAKLLLLTRFGLDISHVQETLVASAASDDSGDVREMARALAERQGRVHHGLESFERDFNDLISDEVLFKSAFVSAVSEMMDSAGEAVDAFEATHVHSGRQLAGQNLEKLNRVVAKLIEVVQQLMNQKQSASMEGFFDQLQKLIEQQQKINDQAERLRQEPSTNPMLQQMMQRMAAEQSMVRQAMEQLAKKYKEAKDVVGDMEGVAQEMKEVEEALKKFDNSDQTRQKQKQILYRMLEADKSIHKQGESKKRESKVARDYAPTQVDPVEQELTEVRQKLFNNLSRESYPVEHRDLVEKYLRSIAQ